MEATDPNSGTNPFPSNDQQTIVRPLANYQPNQWDYASIQTITNDYKEEAYGSLAKELKEEVKLMFNGIEPLAQLRLIDWVERLGLGYHFEVEINVLLNGLLSVGYHKMVLKNGLHATAVLFRLLRQHGYMVSEEIFYEFKDNNGNFMASLSQDVKGLMALYEASYLSFDGESTLDLAREFAVRNLNDQLDASRLAHAMELPSHWRLPRLEIRRYIHIYEMEEDMNSTLLCLAKIDFNMVQNIHQRELIKATCWWTRVGLAKKLSFARDRILEVFFGAVNIIFQPQFPCCLEWLPRIGAQIIILDDIYDAYGSFDELKLFTGVIERWEIKDTENLPECMRICFEAISSTCNEMAHKIQRLDGWEILAHLKKMWADLCKSFLLEAKWNHTKYIPTFDEYLNNGWISVSGPLILFHVEVLLRQEQAKATLKVFENCQRLVKLSSTIFRLCNDLATSSAELERDEGPTSIQCYMNEVGVSEVVAREHISNVISNTWKEMNREFVVCSSSSRPFLNACISLARMTICLYQYRDGFGIPNQEIKEYIMSLLIKPIAFTENGIPSVRR
nr:terpene synthase TPS11 [Freesia refracta]